MASDAKEPPSEFRLFPLGKVTTSKGTFWLTEDDAKACIKAHLAYGNDLSIDYGHGAYEEANGEPQRAAGWIGAMVLRSDGLYAVRVTWTETARRMIARREQRYFSPSFSVTETGHIREIHNVALTLLPATHNLRPLVASKRTQGTKPMDKLLEIADGLEKIVSALEGISDEDKSSLLAVADALRKIVKDDDEAEETYDEAASEGDEDEKEEDKKEKASKVATLLSIAKEVTGKQRLSEIAGALRGLKAHQDQGEKLAVRLSALEDEIKRRDVTDLVNKASRPGKECKLAPSQREWAIQLGMTDPSQLMAFLASAPVLAGQRAAEAPPAHIAVATLSSQEEQIIERTGISREAYIARKAAAKLPDTKENLLMALTADRLTPKMGADNAIPDLLYVPVKGSTKIYAGSIVALSAGYAVPGSTAAGRICIGRAEAQADNSGSATDGAIGVTVRQGVFRFENSSSSDAIAQANIGGLCYVVDDATVALTSASGTRSVAGTIVAVESSGVWVLMMMPVAGQNVQTLGTLNINWNKNAADGAAGTATSEIAFSRPSGSGVIIGSYFIPSAGLTASDTDYATLTLAKRDGAGGSSATVAAVTTKTTGGGGSGNWTAFVPVSLGTLSNASFSSGNVLTIAIAKTGSGVVVPAGQLVVVTQLG